jgi:hypothetical protein
MTVGFALGPLLSGLVTQWAPQPRLTAYLPAGPTAAFYVLTYLGFGPRIWWRWHPMLRVIRCS